MKPAAIAREPLASPKRVSINVVAGGISSFVSVLGGFIATPLYLSLLGAEAFGVLGFVLVLQTALLALDGGIAMSATREVAQSREQPARGSTTDLIHGLGWVSACIAATIAGLIALLATGFAGQWLNLGVLERGYVAQSLMIAGVAIGVRWPLALYQGVLIGSQRLVSLSVISVCTTMLTIGGAVTLMAWVAADLRLLFGWMVTTGLIQLLWSRHVARLTLGQGRRPPKGELPAFFRASAPAGGLGLVGVLLMQVDKVVLSKTLDLGQFGYYVMAATLAAGLYALVTPVFNVLYPQFAMLAAQADQTKLQRLYRDSSLALGSFIFPVAAAMAFLADSILWLWTGDAAAVEAGTPIARLLILATALHAIMFVPFALKLACGASRLALAIGVSLLVFSLPAMIVAALHWGATGAAGAWLVLTSHYILLGSALTHRRLLPGLGPRWLLYDVAPPALLSLGTAFTLAWWTSGAAWSAVERTGLGALLVLVCWAAMASASTRLRLGVRSFVARKAGT